MKNLVFYDGTCGFCDHIVQLLLSLDKNKQFIFAPLQGETAAELLKDLPEEYKNEDSLVLIENYQEETRSYYVLGKAAFRIMWILGGILAIPGAVSFLPSFLYDWGYRLIAKNRHKLFSNSCHIPTDDEKDRFLN